MNEHLKWRLFCYALEAGRDSKTPRPKFRRSTFQRPAVTLRERHIRAAAWSRFALLRGLS